MGLTIGYHVTNRRNMASIQAQGLRRDACGWDAGYNWFFDSQELAVERSRDGWGGSKGENVIFVIDLTGVEVIPDPHPGWEDPRLDDHAFATPENLPAERVHLLEVPR